MKTLCIAAVAFYSCLCLEGASPAPVKVEGGLVEGTADGDLTVYERIPFAAPPVGDLRWRAPQPVPKWEGVRKADQFAPACIPSMGGPSPSGASEDCLYLNVWTPAKSPSEGVPVLVWIYGGGFNAGATSYPVHNGEKLARRGVELVSITYRAGILGFFAHPELSAESSRHVSGNYGVLDMIAGLQWIQRNIAAFWRRSQAGDDFRRIGRRNCREHALRLSPGQRAFSGGDLGERRLLRALQPDARAGREHARSGGRGGFGRRSRGAFGERFVAA